MFSNYPVSDSNYCFVANQGCETHPKRGEGFGAGMRTERGRNEEKERESMKRGRQGAWDTRKLSRPFLGETAESSTASAPLGTGTRRKIHASISVLK